ncbi:MAG: glycosyl hydrolase [Phycisphaerae bacterium]|nr:glycosyl hydrolase [Phycisphaerae bacterium]
MSEWIKQLKNPPAAFRGAPFWAWNSRLDKKELVRQVDEFARAGFGGFFMHVRYGLETDYMSPEFMDCIKAVVEAAKTRKMEAWLYDEDRWPSGFAGGVVTAIPENRIKFLMMQTVPAKDFTGAPADALRCCTAVVDGNTARDIQPLAPGDRPADGRSVLLFSAHIGGDVGWFNNTAYLDAMNPAAVRKFIEVTHEAYKRAVGEEFGKTIPGIFTDEPNFGHFRTWGTEGGLTVPWTTRLDAEFRKRFGYDLLDHLPELFLDVEGATASSARHDYRRLTTELYAEAFSRQIGEWCGRNHLEFTGHQLQEQPLSVQIDQVGACMPHYEYFQRPGIDYLMDKEVEVLTAKQCVSVASQLGRPRVLSELYGCTGWDATFEQYKYIGDWHQVLGINHFCPHLSWYSMAGGAKRDYPAGIFYQSPWWADHKLLGDYFGRLSLALSQGTSVRHVAVIHPIESAWAVHKKHAASESNALSQSLERLCVDLLDNQYDFDFADESMLPRHGSVEAGGSPRFKVGVASYRVVIVPESLTLRTTTVELLERFLDAGGRVVFVGQTPTRMDCQPSDRLARLVQRAVRVPNSGKGLMGASVLGDLGRDVRVENARGWNEPAAAAWVHLRKTDAGGLLFVHHRDRTRGALVKVTWAGEGRVREIDARAGRISDVPGVETKDGVQTFRTPLDPTGSRLFLRVAEGAKSAANSSAARAGTARLAEPEELRRVPLAPVWDYALDEPNAINLDYCRVRVAGVDKNWRPRQLIWRHERDIRKEAGFRDNARPAEQPYIWLKGLSPRVVPVEIEFELDVEAPPAGPVSLVLEHPERFEVSVNGKPVKPGGGVESPLTEGEQGVDWFVDRSFRIVALKGVKLRKGANRITLRTDYREHHWLEEVYVIGRFGVRAAGDRVVVTALPKKLSVGDWCSQGLAMYSGAVNYRQTVRAPKLAAGERLVLKLDRPKATLIRVAVNGRPVGVLPWAPWVIDVTDAVKPGVANRIELTLVSSRRNLLGPLHYVPKNPRWTGPGEFRSEPGSLSFTPAYSLVPYGLLGETMLVVER